MPPEQDLLLGPVPTLLPAVGSERHDRGAARWPSGGRAGWRGAGVLLGLTTAISAGLRGPWLPSQHRGLWQEGLGCVGLTLTASGCTVHPSARGTSRGEMCCFPGAVGCM